MNCIFNSAQTDVYLISTDDEKKGDSDLDESHARMKRKGGCCVFNAKHAEKYPFLEKTKNASLVHCQICNSKFSILHKGKADIEQHMKSIKHRRALQEALKFQSNIEVPEPSLDTAELSEGKLEISS